jgi:hypothetical protein
LSVPPGIPTTSTARIFAATIQLVDKASGKLVRRLELDKALLSASRSGDRLVVTKLDRLGRSLEQLIVRCSVPQCLGAVTVIGASGGGATYVPALLFRCHFSNWNLCHNRMMITNS